MIANTGELTVRAFRDGSRYNQGVKYAALAAATLVAALLGSACSSNNIDNKDAVRTAMIDYLKAKSASTGLDPNAMDVNVDAVAFERDTARATVSFTVKGSDQGMQFNYTLNRDGGKWVVAGRNDQTAAPHGLPSAPGAPAAPAIGDPGKEPLLPVPLPGTSAKELPAGHPPVSGGPAK
ncbi:MAG: hypothetical protein ABI811_23720 [Acidobacteriota bacterium]